MIDAVVRMVVTAVARLIIAFQGVISVLCEVELE